MISVMIVLLVIVEVICSLLLLCVILLQRSKGGGLGMAIGMEMGESLFGARATDVLVKTTIWLGAIFLINTTALAWLYTHQAKTEKLTSSPLSSTATPGSPLATPAPAAPNAPISGPVEAAPPAAPAPMTMPMDMPAAPAPVAPASAN